ncbi:class I SAM-dependent methyltransferase [Roseococcus sp.]|uniref:class I SAM-dependent methyltransferase n=1 Tax=Roseococcus sp. TaxID=2109646 RepID=UPI003BAD64D0
MLVAEDFKPIPIRRAEGTLGRLLFALRITVDLQLLTCLRFLSPILAGMRGGVLDVGCGEMPFRGLLPADARYTGIDVPAAEDFGMTRNAEIVNFDGLHIPFPDDSFDHILCTEVLEHAQDPVGLVAEMLRVLRSGGTIAATVPFSARVHHAPHDYHRFTRYRLAELFAGFREVKVEERGDDLATIANKLIVVCMRLIQPSMALVWRLPLLPLVGLAALTALGIAHLSIRLGWGSKADPLGYGVFARKA